MHRQSTWATEPLSFSPVWNSQYFKSGFLKQSASLDHLFVCSSTPSLPPTNGGKNPEYKFLSLNISLTFSSSLWPCVNPVVTLAHVGSWPTAGKHWPKSKMLVGLPLRGDLTAFCGCGAASERMLWAANHQMLCFIHIREFVPWSLRRNKAHTAQKWGFCNKLLVCSDSWGPQDVFFRILFLSWNGSDSKMGDFFLSRQSLGTH